MNRSPVTWALVSDGGKARILSMKRYPPEFREILTLSREAQTGSFDSLVIAADPRTLGKIRNVMGRQLREKLALELNLDLTGLKKDRLERRLRAALDWPLS